MRNVLAPFCVEVTPGEWAQLARSTWVTHALKMRWFSLIREDGRLRCVLARRSLETFAETGKRLWRYSEVDVQFLQSLQDVLQKTLAEQARAGRGR